MENFSQDATMEFLAGHVGVLRLLAFREDDKNNRRLLFDSDSIGGDQNDFVPSHRGQPDSKLLAEMIFGSTPTVCNGESIKVHQFRNPMRMMFTKIFPAHQLTASGVASLQRDAVQRRFSVDPEYIGRGQNGSEINVIAALPKHSKSDVLPQRVSSSGSRRSSESSEDIEILPALHRLRRQRIGISVLFTVGEESQLEDERIVNRRVQFLCAQSAAIFGAIKDELQDVVLTAYCARASVVEIMKRAWRRFLLCVKSLCESTCRAHHLLRYFKISWSPTPGSSDSSISRFIDTLSALGTKLDTRQTNFFLSTLITSVLGLSRIRHMGGGTKKTPDIVFKCNDGKLLIQLVEITGYFLKFVISDFDRVSVKSVPIPLMRSLSSRSTSKTASALASLWSMVRSRKSIRDGSTGDISVSSSPSRRRESNGLLSSSPSSPMNGRDVPVILVKENDLEEEGSDSERISTMDRYPRSELDENTVSVSSSIHSSSSATNFPGSGGGSGEDDETLSNFFDGVEEVPLPSCSAMGNPSTPADEPLQPLCGNLELYHKFSEEASNGRPLDMAISFCEFTGIGTEATQDAMVVDATTWKVYQTCNDDAASHSTNNNWSICFPSALITEMLENVRTFGAQNFDANFCLMYMEDEIKNLFSKVDAVTRLIGDGSDKSELRSEFCTKVMRCDIVDLSFLLK